MKTYREYLGEVLNSTSFREHIEWTNTWIDSAEQITPPNDVEAKNKQVRILIIGDSTARMVRSTLAKITKCPVDMIGTSSNIYDELFVNLVDSFFNNSVYYYDAIYVQLGHHGRMGIDGGNFSNEDLCRYKENMKSLLSFLQQFSKCIIVETIFDAVVPVSRLHKYLIRLHMKQERLDAKINAITQAKNRVLFSLCENSPYRILDINDFMNHQHYLHIDHIHFEQRAKKVIAMRMIKEIKDMIQ